MVYVCGCKLFWFHCCCPFVICSLFACPRRSLCEWARLTDGYRCWCCRSYILIYLHLCAEHLMSLEWRQRKYELIWLTWCNMTLTRAMKNRKQSNVRRVSARFSDLNKMRFINASILGGHSADATADQQGHCVSDVWNYGTISIDSMQLLL